MNKITNVRLHTPLFRDYQEVCAILSSLGFNPPTRHHYEFVFIYCTNATGSDSTTWFNNHRNTFIETSDYIKRRGLKHPFLLKRKGI